MHLRCRLLLTAADFGPYGRHIPIRLAINLAGDPIPPQVENVFFEDVVVDACSHFRRQPKEPRGGLTVADAIRRGEAL